MIGVVTHCYPNGSFTVFFADGQFGAKGFSKAVPEGERFEPGDRVDCEFSAGGRGTVIRAVRVAAKKHVPKVENPARTATTGRLHMTGTPAGEPGMPSVSTAMGHHVK